MGLYTGTILGGAILTETVFSRPGIGKLLVGAIQQRDYNLIQGGVIVFAIMIMCVNLLVDLSYGLIDRGSAWVRPSPRARPASRRRERRLRRRSRMLLADRGAGAGLVFIASLIAIAVLAPLISPFRRPRRMSRRRCNPPA